MTEEITVPKGLANVVVDSTSIATTGSSGHLLYRGYRAIDIAEKKKFEDAAFLIVNGRLPDEKERNQFTESLMKQMSLDSTFINVIRDIKEKDIMRNIRTLVSAYHYRSNDVDDLFLEMEGKLPVFSVYTSMIYDGKNIENFSGDGFSDAFFRKIGKKIEFSRSYEKLMILYMEHEFNASTFALRVAASTLTDPVSAVTAALATLKGPLHGGANSEVLSYLGSIHSRDDAKNYVEQSLSSGKKIMGFGHRVYKKKDPRAQFVKSELQKIAPDHEKFKAATYVEEYMFEKKGIPANVDLYAAVLMDYLGIEEKYYLPVFACSRIFGWHAHYKEQVENNKLIRPAAQYIGPEERDL
ncbi:citrate/2-methylcitrate synthase [Caldiplasma sukawensis]